MQQEIECKFINVSHDKVRTKLESLGAQCIHPVRIMRRVMFDHLDDRFQKNKQHEHLRVRDEGDKVTVTYKKSTNSNYLYEVETNVGSFEEMCRLFESIGLHKYSYQESKRETWKLEDTEIELDEWPWLNPYIEIEGKTEEVIKDVANKLGFDWKSAEFGSVDTVYRLQYPIWTRDDSIGDVPEVKFGAKQPKWFKKGKT